MKQPIYCEACLAAGKKTIAAKRFKIKITNKTLSEHNFCEKCYSLFLQKMDKVFNIRIQSERGRKGGLAPHKRPKDYFSKIAKLPRKRKK